MVGRPPRRDRNWWAYSVRAGRIANNPQRIRKHSKLYRVTWRFESLAWTQQSSARRIPSPMGGELPRTAGHATSAEPPTGNFWYCLTTKAVQKAIVFGAPMNSKCAVARVSRRASEDLEFV